MNIFITGATGFLGSHIAENLIEEGHQIIALKRSTSSLWRCVGFNESIKWIDYDDITEVERSLLEFKPDVLIHSAWLGVKAAERDSWIEQVKNTQFLIEMLEVAKKAGIRKIIALGSQAEYGSFEGAIAESAACKPTTAYGSCKFAASNLLKDFALQNEMEWYWIRLFSVYGPREDKNWLIPAAISNLINSTPMNLTKCEQKYDYLYARDFAKGISAVVNCSINHSGIYNMSGNSSTMLYDILSYLESKFTNTQKVFQFGSLAYRPNQVMHMEGKSDLFYKTFSFKPAFSLESGLDETIKYYTDNL